jgi:hypothetical protein
VSKRHYFRSLDNFINSTGSYHNLEKISIIVNDVTLQYISMLGHFDFGSLTAEVKPHFKSDNQP